MKNHRDLFIYDARNPNADVSDLLKGVVEPFCSLRIRFPAFSGDGFTDHIVRSTGSSKFRSKVSRADWIWLIQGENTNGSHGHVPGALNKYIPARLNCLFKLRISRGDHVYRFAHVSLTTVVGGKLAKNEEGMIKVRMSGRNAVVKVAHIAEMAHLIPIEPNDLWYINNRIDLWTWNMVYSM